MTVATVATQKRTAADSETHSNKVTAFVQLLRRTT